MVGLNVSIAKRICDLTGPDKVFVSEQVRAFLADSDVAVFDQGTRVLKGYRLTNVSCLRSRCDVLELGICGNSRSSRVSECREREVPLAIGLPVSPNRTESCAPSAFSTTMTRTSFSAAPRGRTLLVGDLGIKKPPAQHW